jgi:hypothetical protein
VFEDRVFELDFALDLDWMRESALINLETWGKRDVGFGASGLDRTRVSLVPLAARTLMRLFLFFSAASKSPARKDSRSWKRTSPSSEEVSHRVPPERYNGKSRRSCEPSHDPDKRFSHDAILLSLTEQTCR